MLTNRLNTQKNMVAIKCKSGRIFSACNENYMDAEWKLQEAYYKAQGCTVELLDEVRFSECECDHCKSLEHEFENLIEEVKSEQ
jgi:hypothetical protein